MELRLADRTIGAAGDAGLAGHGGHSSLPSTNLRIALLLVSAMKRPPDPSRTMPCGP